MMKVGVRGVEAAKRRCWSGQCGVIVMKKITPTLVLVKTIFPDTKMWSTTSCSCGTNLELYPGFVPVGESVLAPVGDGPTRAGTHVAHRMGCEGKTRLKFSCLQELGCSDEPVVEGLEILWVFSWNLSSWSSTGFVFVCGPQAMYAVR